MYVRNACYTRRIDSDGKRVSCQAPLLTSLQTLTDPHFQVSTSRGPAAAAGPPCAGCDPYVGAAGAELGDRCSVNCFPSVSSDGVFRGRYFERSQSLERNV